MRNWTKLTAAGAISVLALASAALAVQDAPGRNARGRGGPGHPALRLLDLSQDQQAKVDELFRQHREDIKPLLDKQRELHQQMRDALAADNPDAAAVGQLVIDGHHLREQMKAERERLDDSIASLLNPEQKALWQKMRSAREKGRGRGPGRGLRGGPGGGPGPGGFGPPEPPEGEIN